MTGVSPNCVSFVSRARERDRQTALVLWVLLPDIIVAMVTVKIELKKLKYDDE